MFCPHCHNKIPDGSNICPLCYSSLAGVRPEPERPEQETDNLPENEERPAPARKKNASRKNTAYTKGSRGSRHGGDRTPMIIAFGLILILVIIIAMIIRSMFSAGAPTAPVVTPIPQRTPEGNFIVFGATSTPVRQATPTPNLEITPTPPPAQPAMPAELKTLRKGDQGPEVVTLQKALTELGFLKGASDGNFGTGTQTAVKNFQEAHGLDADGIAGRKTLEKLFELSTVTPIPEVTVGPGDILDLPG